MKKILYLSFYFEPDLSACSFRNSPLVKELAHQAKEKASIEVLTTMPNRYDASLTKTAVLETEQRDNYTIYRFDVPENKGGMKSQILSYQAYFRAVRKFVKQRSYDLVIASTAKLFTGYLAHTIAKKQQIPLYLDVRDLFHENLDNMLKNGLPKALGLPAIKTIERKTFSNATHINIISGGFTPNFEEYPNPSYSNYTNGIDDLFLNFKTDPKIPKNTPLRIVYAGNIGEGQGLHKIIPEAAKKLGSDYQFIVIGDGGNKPQMAAKIKELQLNNVELKAPVKREELLEIYRDSDFTFVHLNDYDSFKKVLPSKIFELACFPQPMIAGVSGFANKFVAENIKNRILFEPCDVADFVGQLKNFEHQKINRTEFKEKFKRSAINKAMAESMMTYL